jgi:hypothetical protein
MKVVEAEEMASAKEDLLQRMKTRNMSVVEAR